MFHHFHDGKKDVQSQGSITGKELEAMIIFLKKRCTLLSAPEWQKRAETDTLKPDEICLTFDDALKCQYDIALPVLEKYNLKAFWFIYTAPLVGEIEKLELYRYYRNTEFENIKDFYRAFDAAVKKSAYRKKIEKGLAHFDPKRIFQAYHFYTDGDKKFRYIRDFIISKKEYEEIMDTLMGQSPMNTRKIIQALWMSSNDIKNLHRKGHVIGLHSHNHPTNMRRLNKKEQFAEYKKNSVILEKITGEKITAMSHPDNAYDARTLALLKKLGIKIGFRATVDQLPSSKLEYPRIDHAYLIKKVRK